MSQSIGKILDELLAGTITKQEAVTKLQRNRNRQTKVSGLVGAEPSVNPDSASKPHPKRKANT